MSVDRQDFDRTRIIRSFAINWIKSSELQPKVEPERIIDKLRNINPPKVEPKARTSHPILHQDTSEWLRRKKLALRIRPNPADFSALQIIEPDGTRKPLTNGEVEALSLKEHLDVVIKPLSRRERRVLNESKSQS
jgi:hypothetical protein